MKVNIEFDMPEDQDELILALKGKELWSILFDLDQKLRNYTKYDNPKIDTNTAEVIRNELHELMDNYNISLDMVD